MKEQASKLEETSMFKEKCNEIKHSLSEKAVKLALSQGWSFYVLN